MVSSCRPYSSTATGERARVAEADIQTAMTRDLMNRAFGGSASQLVMRALSKNPEGRYDDAHAMSDDSKLLINALTRDLHSGENPRYGRPGRIPGSCNIPANELIDKATKRAHRG